MMKRNKHYSDDPSSAQNVRYLALRNTPLLTKEEEQEYGTIIQKNAETKGPEYSTALNKMIESNVRLVAKIAQRYVGCSSLSLSDLFGEGCLGLRKAAERFDPQLGYRFSTYASWWIKQTMVRAMANDGTIVRLPVNIQLEYRRITKYQRRYSTEYGIDPSLEDIASGIGMPVKKVQRTILSVNQVNKPASFQELVDYEENSTLEEFIPDRKSDVFKEATYHELTEKLTELLSHLKERERTVLECRYGLKGIQLTLDEIAQSKDFLMTRQRVSQIEQSALLKLKKLLVSQKKYAALRSYIEE